MHQKTLHIVLLISCFTISSCSYQEVKPWQKKDLARPEMQFSSDSVESLYKSHFYFSKEGSSGGKGFAGGGCGCN